MYVCVCVCVCVCVPRRTYVCTTPRTSALLLRFAWLASVGRLRMSTVVGPPFVATPVHDDCHNDTHARTHAHAHTHTYDRNDMFAHTTFQVQVQIRQTGLKPDSMMWVGLQASSTSYYNQDDAYVLCRHGTLKTRRA